MSSDRFAFHLLGGFRSGNLKEQSMKATRAVLAMAVISVLLGASSIAQGPPPSDAQAIRIIQDARGAMGIATTPVNSVSLAGSFTWAAGGAIFSGTVNLAADGTTQSRADYSAGGFQRSEIRNDTLQPPAGAWIDNSGQSHAMSGANCWTDAVWFFPPLFSSLSLDPSIVLLYAGQETRNGTVVDHVQAYKWVGSSEATSNSIIAALSLRDLYFDANSHLLVGIAYPLHFDSDDNRSVRAEITFSNYQHTNNLLVPYRIRRRLNGSLNLDITVNSATINPPVSPTDFAVQ